MNNNDTTTTARYSVWPTDYDTAKETPEHATIEDARLEWEHWGNKSPDEPWRIWDHSTTPPTDVTNANPEGAHPPTPAPTIPPSVEKITIQRDHYATGDHARWYVSVKAGIWSASYSVHDNDLFTSLADLTAHMEKIK